MDVKIEESWKEVLSGEFSKDYFKKLAEFVRSEYKKGIVYPPAKSIFNSFLLTPFNDVKVVILGQDPYHGANQAHGLCFSVNDGVPIPPSLINVYKEIHSDLGSGFESGNLEKWAKQGVLLLNSTLTVLPGKPGSHQGKGWEEFTDSVIKTLNDKREGLVFLLWGAYAQKKAGFLDESKHLVLRAAHPSPFSADKGFFGCRHFSKTNQYLASKGLTPIAW